MRTYLFSFCRTHIIESTYILYNIGKILLNLAKDKLNRYLLSILANNKYLNKAMKRKSKKRKVNSNITNKKDSDENKNTAKIVLFIFGIGPIIGIIIFLASKGFFNSPQI